MTETEQPFLPLVRRLEAVGFRAWPAADIRYDGSWQIRITPGHPSRRLNCVVPLDPSDIKDIGPRLAAAARLYADAASRLTIRQSPLCPPQLTNWLGEHGFVPKARTLVMTADMADIDLGDGMDLLPSHDIGRFVDACLAIDTARDTSQAVLGSILSAIRPPSGLFLIEDETTGPRAVTLCVHDNDMAGLSQVVVAAASRRQGIGRQIVSAALRWARLRGARHAWLQVMADNAPACALYESMGFRTRYDYCYWQEA